MPERYHIDFSQMTMNTTLASDKRIPPLYTLVKNTASDNDGTFKKRSGYVDLATSGDLVAGSSNVIAIAPVVLNNISSAADAVAISGNTIYEMLLTAAGWTSTGITDATSATHYQYSWGFKANGTPCIYLAPCPGSLTTGGKIYRHEYLGGTTTRLGMGTNGFTTGRCTSFLLNRLWVGMADATIDKVKYSVAGDDDDFNGTGSGSLSLRPTGGGYYPIMGMAVYQNRLYFACGPAIIVLTGTTPSTFGTQHIRYTELVNGGTMYATGGYLFWVADDGIWQFNGSEAVNISRRDIRSTFQALGVSEIRLATATWNTLVGSYSVYFQTSQILLEYNYTNRTWKQWAFSGSDAIKVIGPPMSSFTSVINSYRFGLGAANGGAFVMRDSATTDDGVGISSQIQSGYLHLAAMSNQGTYGDDFRLVALELHVAKRSAAVTYKMTWQTDTQPTAEAQKTFTVTAADSDQDYPTIINANALLPTHRTGKYVSFTLTEETSGVRGDLRGMTFYFDVMKRN